MLNHVGFTGTQRGMTEHQKRELRQWLNILKNHGKTHFHHGDCVGADIEASTIASELGFKIVLHPPENQSKRAFCSNAVEVMQAKPYLERNHDIVDAVEEMIACPGEPNEVLRSGTWATIRYARRSRAKLLIIRPEGIA